MAAQLALSWQTPLWLVHRHRVPYDIVKDDISNMDLALRTVSGYVHRHGITDYLIVLGDSVGYSGPGGPEQAVSRYLEDLSRLHGGPAVFNFSIPGAQIGDIYVMLLKLYEHGLTPSYLVVNTIYSGFVARTPDPPPVFWLRDELARLDPEADLITPPAYPRGRTDATAAEQLEDVLVNLARRWLPAVAYRDYIRAAILELSRVSVTEGGDSGPWYERPWLEHYLRQPEYLRTYDPQPLVLDESNPNVYFLQRLVDTLAPGCRLLFFASPVNQSLLADLQAEPAYLHNRRAIDVYLRSLAASHPATDYIDLTLAIPDDLFSDNLHLIPEGYRLLAELIWDELFPASSGAAAGPLR